MITCVLNDAIMMNILCRLLYTLMSPYKIITTLKGLF